MHDKRYNRYNELIKKHAYSIEQQSGNFKFKPETRFERSWGSGAKDFSERVLTKEEFYEMMAVEKITAGSIEIHTSLSRKCNCVYSNGGSCPFGLAIGQPSEVDESVEPTMEAAKKYSRRPCQPAIEKAGSEYVCKGYWKPFIQQR